MKKIIKGIVSAIDVAAVLLTLIFYGSAYLSETMIDPTPAVQIVFMAAVIYTPLRLLWRVIADAGR